MNTIQDLETRYRRYKALGDTAGELKTLQAIIDETENLGSELLLEKAVELYRELEPRTRRRRRFWDPWFPAHSGAANSRGSL